MVSLLLVFWGLLAGVYQVALVSMLNPSSRSRVGISLTVGKEDKLEEDVEQ